MLRHQNGDKPWRISPHAAMYLGKKPGAASPYMRVRVPNRTSENGSVTSTSATHRPSATLRRSRPDIQDAILLITRSSAVSLADSGKVAVSVWLNRCSPPLPGRRADIASGSRILHRHGQLR